MPVAFGPWKTITILCNIASLSLPSYSSCSHHVLYYCLYSSCMWSSSASVYFQSLVSTFPFDILLICLYHFTWIHSTLSTRSIRSTFLPFFSVLFYTCHLTKFIYAKVILLDVLFVVVG